VGGDGAGRTVRLMQDAIRTISAMLPKESPCDEMRRIQSAVGQNHTFKRYLWKHTIPKEDVLVDRKTSHRGMGSSPTMLAVLVCAQGERNEE
jgi:hypothetical protein